jgi:hypothetical protein
MARLGLWATVVTGLLLGVVHYTNPTLFRTALAHVKSAVVDSPSCPPCD